LLSDAAPKPKAPEVAPPRWPAVELKVTLFELGATLRAGVGRPKLTPAEDVGLASKPGVTPPAGAPKLNPEGAACAVTVAVLAPRLNPACPDNPLERDTPKDVESPMVDALDEVGAGSDPKTDDVVLDVFCPIVVGLAKLEAAPKENMPDPAVSLAGAGPSEDARAGRPDAKEPN